MTDTTPGTDLVYASASLGERKEYARSLAAAGSLLPKGLMEKNDRGMDVPSPGKILLIAETGNMLSIHPVAAIQGVNIIEGQPTLSPALMSALVRRAGHKLRVKQDGVLEDGTYRVTVEIIRRDDPDFTYRAVWTMDRAARAGLVKWEQKDGRWKATARSQKGNPLPWESYSEAMLTSRAIGECSRMAAEDVLLGIHYTPEEMGAVVNEAGEALGVDEIIDGEVVEDDGGPRHTGTRGHANETQVKTASDRQPTPGSGPRPSPSRTVTSPGAGRATPASDGKTAVNRGNAGNADEPSEETRAAVADYVERIAAEDDIERLRDLHGDASAHGLLATPTGDGRRLNDAFYQRREAILQAQEMPPALDGIEDDA